MKTKYLICVLVLLKSNLIFTKADVNIVGFLKFANGLGRVTTTWVDILSNDFNVKFVESRPGFFNYQDIPHKVIKISQNKKLQASNNVSIMTDVPWLPSKYLYKNIPNSLIKIAYSMCESTKIPAQWVTIFNNEMDAIIVPDEFLIDVYKNSGVEIPIFVIPIALYLEDFLKRPLKKSTNKPFVFGVSAALSKNKNIELLIEAFHSEFCNNKNIILKIHSPWINYKQALISKINSLNVKNVELHIGELNWVNYINFMQSIDCYVLLSKGEGFSITPREAMSLGIPCILSNNSAQKTICNTNLVLPVNSNIKQISDQEFYGTDVGFNFNCDIKDVKIALRCMYKNYNSYLKDSKKRRFWAKKYLKENLLQYYINIVKPKKIILSDKNEVTKEFLMTNSIRLYNKYIKLLKNNY